MTEDRNSAMEWMAAGSSYDSSTADERRRMQRWRMQRRKQRRRSEQDQRADPADVDDNIQRREHLKIAAASQLRAIPLRQLP